MTVDLVARRLEQGFRLAWIGGGNRLGRHYPDADAFLAPRIEITCVLDRHTLISGVQAADMLVIETAARTDENFVQGPVASVVHPSSSNNCRAQAAQRAARKRCFSAWALAASRTHAPAAWALRRAASRSALQGPLPFSTCSNSSQSIGPNS